MTALVPAATLTAAAQRLQELAGAATPGPWRWVGDYPSGTCPHESEWVDHGPNLVTVATEHVVGDTAEWDSPIGTVISSSGYDASHLDISDGDAALIAAMSPTVALAVADLLEQLSHWIRSSDRPEVAAHSPDALAALTLARLTLEETPHG